jgi:hypothetical protein
MLLLLFIIEIDLLEVDMQRGHVWCGAWCLFFSICEWNYYFFLGNTTTTKKKKKQKTHKYFIPYSPCYGGNLWYLIECWALYFSLTIIYTSLSLSLLLLLCYFDLLANQSIFTCMCVCLCVWKTKGKTKNPAKFTLAELQQQTFIYLLIIFSNDAPLLF